MEHYKAGRYKEAVETFKQAIRLTPGDAEAHYRLGEAYFNLSQDKEAIEAYQQAIKLKPDYFAAYNNLGTVYLTQHNYTDAIKLLTEATQRNPDYSIAHYNLGVAYLESGNRNGVLEQHIILGTIDRQRAFKLYTLFNKQGKPVSNVAFNAKAVALPEPEYLQLAGAARAAGTVAVVATIDESGKVISARAIRGHPLLREASVAAALKARFTPTTVDGRAIKVTGIMTYDFIPGARPRQNLPSYVLHP